MRLAGLALLCRCIWVRRLRLRWTARTCPTPGSRGGGVKHGVWHGCSRGVDRRLGRLDRATEDVPQRGQREICIRRTLKTGLSSWRCRTSDLLHATHETVSATSEACSNRLLKRLNKRTWDRDR